MDRRRYQELPEGLAATPPGAALGAALETLDPELIAPADVSVVLAAQQRQINRDQARMLQLRYQSGLADASAPGGRKEVLDQFSAGDARATLTESKTYAWNELALAEALTVGLPGVLAGMLDGHLDVRRARALRLGTEVLSAEHTAKVLAGLLAEAPGIPVGALINRIAADANAVDPDWADKNTKPPWRSAGCGPG